MNAMYVFAKLILEFDGKSLTYRLCWVETSYVQNCNFSAFKFNNSKISLEVVDLRLDIFVWRSSMINMELIYGKKKDMDRRQQICTFSRVKWTNSAFYCVYTQNLQGKVTFLFPWLLLTKYTLIYNPVQCKHFCSCLCGDHRAPFTPSRPP